MREKLLRKETEDTKREKRSEHRKQQKIKRIKREKEVTVQKRPMIQEILQERQGSE